MNESHIFMYTEGLDGGTFLAGINDSAGYEIDYTEVWKTENGFALLTASGCSCWDGDFLREDFDSLDSLESSLKKDDHRTYGNPSVESIDVMMKDAREKLELDA